ncbi:MAG TPA: hypothetical protein VK749_06525 [Xanthobacteraceae bacterium]|jgi:hypothetical protein|nr:hypothetical protein [Xanthobacteraceae bacterium]
MRSALYYPHTHIQNEGLIKNALLLWDRLEYIVPWNHFRPHYRDRHIAEAMELIGVPHCPAPDEQREAHVRLEEFVQRRLPGEFYLRRSQGRRRTFGHEEPYEMYPEKLLPASWEILRKARMAGKLLGNLDYPLTEYAGLTVMSILADCCAGTTRSRVTDRGEAYATVAGLLGNNPNALRIKRIDAHAQLVPISLKVIDVAAMDLAALINLRKREEKETNKSLRDLRHRYLDGLEGYVARLADTKTTKADAKEIQRQFVDDMKRDLRDLKTELGFARTAMFTSKELIATVVTGVGTAASWLAGLQLPLEGVITLGGAPVAIGGLLAMRNKYLKERQAVMKKHPMAYLYQAGRLAVRKRSLFTPVSN